VSRAGWRRARHLPPALVFATTTNTFGLLGCSPEVTESVHVEPATGRGFRVLTRPDHDVTAPAPVLFALHAYATAPSVLVKAYALARHATDARGWIVVVPEGLKDSLGNFSWNASKACCGEGPSRPDDVAYLRAVLREVKARYSVESARVYAIGVSNGGFMAHRWACEAGGDLRALVSIAGAGPGPDDPPCRADGKVDVLQVHGDRDDVISYAGGAHDGARYPSARETVEAWCKHDGCTSGPRTVSAKPLFFETLRKETWTGAGARVSLWSAEGGDHQLRLGRGLVAELVAFLDAAR